VTPINLRFLLGFAAPYRVKLALAGFLMLAETGVTLAIPWLGGQFAGNMLAGVQARVGWILLALFVLFACQALLRFGHAYLVSVSGERILADLRIRIYDHLQSLPLGFYHQRRRGDILALLTYEAARLSGYITGTLLKGISHLAGPRREIYTAYPAMIDMMGDAGLIVSSAATVKLTLGVLKPSFSSIKNHAKNIFSAWLSTAILFAVLGVLSIAINGLFSLEALVNLMAILLLSNVIAFVLIVLVSYFISVRTFKSGLDPDNFVLPVGNSLADALTTVALFVALFIVL